MSRGSDDHIERPVFSPVATGGSGTFFEQHVCAYWLAQLLIGGTPPILNDCTVVEVSFQTALHGWHTDDFLVVGETPSKARRRMLGQIKKSVSISAADDGFHGAIEAFWHDFNDSSHFVPDADTLALVTLQGTTALLRDFAGLLDQARAARTRAEFDKRLSVAGFANKRLSDYHDHVRAIVSAIDEQADAGDRLWSFLRHIYVLSLDLATDTSQTESSVMNQLALATDEPESSALASATWATLLAIVGHGIPRARRFVRDDLPESLRQRHRAIPPAGVQTRRPPISRVPTTETVLRNYLTQLADDCQRPPTYLRHSVDLSNSIRRRVRFVTAAANTRGAQDEGQTPRQRTTPADNEHSPAQHGATADAPHRTAGELVAWDVIRTSRSWRQIVVLGDPGLGKSWLLRSEARRRCLECLGVLTVSPQASLAIPVLLKIEDLVRHASRTQRFRQTFALALDSSGLDTLTVEHLLERLDRNELVVLLDAWDEVSPRRKREIKHQIELWSKDYSGIVMMASRPATFVRSPLTRDVCTATLLPFDAPDIELYAQRWFGVDSAARFIAALGRHPHVGGLSGNPLLLSFLCRLFEAHDGQFPERRLDLYSRILIGLLKEWRQNDKDATNANWHGEINALLDSVAAFAYDMYPASQFGGDELALQHHNSHLIDRCIRDGLLSRDGAGDDSPLVFIHRTFHEYLAARHLAQQPWDFARVEMLIRDPEWHPVIALMAGQMKRPELLVGLLADRRRDDIFRPRLALAVRCLTEIPEPVRPAALVDRITSAVLDLWLRHAQRGTQCVLGDIEGVLVALAELRGNYRGKPLSLAITQTMKPRWFLMLAERFGEAAATPEVLERLARLFASADYAGADVITRFGKKAATPAIIAALEVKLQAPPNRIPYTVAECLRELGEHVAVPGILDRLIELSRVDVFGAEYIKTIGHMGAKAATPAVLERLVHAISDGPTYSMNREAAVDALRRLGKPAAQPHVITSVAGLLHDPDRDVRRRAADALGHLCEHAITDDVRALIYRLLLDPESEIQSRILRWIGRLGQEVATPEILDRLIDLALSSSEDDYVSSFAQFALPGLCGPKTASQVLERLSVALKAEPPNIRWRAANVIETLGDKGASPTVLGLLAGLLEDAVGVVRGGAAEAISALGVPGHTPEVKTRLEPIS